MTIPSYDNRRSYAGDGNTTAFTFPPPFTANTDLVVQIRAADGTTTTKALGADYAIASGGSPAGGSVTMTVAPATGTTLIIYRDVPLTQSVDLQDGGPLPANTINRALDRITMWGQRLKEQIAVLGTLATQTAAGLMSAADKVKLDGIQPGAQANTVISVSGYTGTVVLAKGDVGLGNADNTGDANKPVSTLQQTAINARAAKAANLSDLTDKDTALANLGGGATGISVLKAANAATALTAIGATATGSSLVTAANASAAHSILGLVPGTDVQAFSARLADIAAIAPSQGDVLYYSSSAWTRLAAGASGQFLRTAGPNANPSWATISGGGDMLKANNLSDVANAATALANIGGVSSSSPSVTGTVTVSGSTAQTINLTASSNTFQLAVQSDGTANISAYSSSKPINYSAGTGGSHIFYVGGIAYLAADATGVNLPSGASYRINGSPLAFSNLAGSATTSQGGTGQTSYTIGDLLYASGPAALSKLADVATGNALISGGVGATPSWGKIGLTTHITGALAITNGGTNITTYATGDTLYANAANTLGKLAIGSTGQVLTVAGGVPVWASTSATWPQGTVYGLTLSQASPTTVGITIGGCANEDSGTAYNMVLGSAITKGLGGWTTGSGNGGLDTGSIAASTWYHVHLIRKDSDGSIDALLSLSATAPSIPVGYTARRRLGSLRTNASSQIISFIQRGDEFIWSVPILDRNSNSASGASLLTLSVPSGIQVKARLLGFTLASTGNSVSMAILSPDIPSQTPTDLGSASTGVAPMPNIASAYNGGAWSSGSAEANVWTNTSSQVNVCVRSSGTAGVIAIQVNGWIDTRGRL